MGSFTQLKKLKFVEINEELISDAQSIEEKEKEPVKKMGKRRKQIARKGLHTAKDEAEKDESCEKMILLMYKCSNFPVFFIVLNPLKIVQDGVKRLVSGSTDVYGRGCFGKT
ncbi:hypothetical protein Tco_1193553 [Tanacetum coccineum]